MSTPVTVIGGYLGAGKTTLINAILRRADGLRIAVLVNEFGALPIDEDLIIAQDSDVISIAGGCICCSFGDSLVDAFTKLLALDPSPDHVVIEASGVAIPASIAATLSLVQGVTFLGTVALADAETVRDRARDRYMGDTFICQLEGADIVLLSKPDLVSAEKIATLKEWLKEIASGAQVIAAESGQVPNAIVLGAFPFGSRTAYPAPEDHGALYKSLALELNGSVNPADLQRILADPSLGILRAKGSFESAPGAFTEIQAVGTRVTYTKADAAPKHCGLVCIGLAARFDAERVLRVLTRLGVTVAASPENAKCETWSHW